MESKKQTHEPIDNKLKEIIAQWKNEEGNLIMVLHAVQSHYGYIPYNVAEYVAEGLGIPKARIYEVTTFYNYFNLEPPAKNTIAICMGTACYLKGAPALIDAVKKEIKLPANAQYTEDRNYKLEEVRCIGCCGLAPVITVNGEVHGRIKPEEIASIIAKCSKK